MNKINIKELFAKERKIIYNRGFMQGKRCFKIRKKEIEKKIVSIDKRLFIIEEKLKLRSRKRRKHETNRRY